MSVKICVSTFPNHLAWENPNKGHQVRKAKIFLTQRFPENFILGQATANYRKDFLIGEESHRLLRFDMKVMCQTEKHFTHPIA